MAHEQGIGQAALDELRQLREHSFAELRSPIQFFAPDSTLDLESRRDSAERMFKHLHQSSVLHRENFCAANKIKHLSLIDAYLDLSATGNALGLYAIARSMFELNAFLHEVRDRLVAAASKAAGDWRGAGEEFFGLLVRARFATTQSDFHKLLRDEGLSVDRLKPFNIKNAVQHLAHDPDHRDAKDRYDTLCDFVHHNLGSTTLTDSGSAASNIAMSSQGGAMITSGKGRIIQYEYPVTGKFVTALEDTAPSFLRDVQACLTWINTVPRSPYTPELVEQFTGTDLGMTVLLTSGRPGTARTGRNEPCPCGGGRKFKRCCGTR